MDEVCEFYWGNNMTRGLTTATLALLLSSTAWGDSYIVKDLSGAMTDSAVQKEQNVVPVFPSLGLYKIESTSRSKDGATKELMQSLNASSKFRASGLSEDNVNVFVDHMMTLRGFEESLNEREDKTPNDLQFEDQWSLQDADETFGINAKAAWAITTGGTNALGKEVVIAIVDNGFDVKHVDLKDNMWVNTGEIPGNGIDDDNNGYVDDINGWNINNNTGNIEVGRHGTHVAGTTGASGDNNIAVTGVNWNTKIMVVSMGRSLAQTTKTLAAYNYILEQKKRWLETNGAEGANVVAINSSFGIDFADCNSGEFTMWNDVYNELGKYGILSAAATANRDIDVDQRGDVPTTCSSPFIVGVTNSTNRGEKARSAAFGAENIDIAAPGTGILSTYPDDRTGESTGTSMATPHVTGSIGLLHAAASTELAQLAIDDPAAAALIMKNILINTVTPITSLSDTTVAGGILDLGAAALSAHTYSSTGEEEEEEEEAEEEEEEEIEEPVEETLLFTSNVIMNIPDAFFGVGVINSTIRNVANVSDIRKMEISVTVDHSHHADLSFNLIAPNGREVLLMFKDNGSGEKTYVYTVDTQNSFENLESLGSNMQSGSWTLQVTDHHFRDSGVLMGWSVKLN